MLNINESLENTTVIEERVNYVYEYVDYSVEGNINVQSEISFLENIFNSILNDEGEIAIIFDNAYNDIELDSVEKILTEYAYYIEGYINEYIEEQNTVSSLEEILNGGIRKYLEAQYTNNRFNIYKNVIYSILNERNKYIKTNYDKETLNYSDFIYLKFDIEQIKDFVDEFISDNIDILEEETDSFSIYDLFSDFLNIQHQ